LMKPKDGRVTFRGLQGTWVQRPGIVDVEVESSGTVVQSVKIIGDAVIVYEAEVQI
jgi:predicted PhzF superfamily epimerase YddE/YHI9